MRQRMDLSSLHLVENDLCISTPAKGTSFSCDGQARNFVSRETRGQALLGHNINHDPICMEPPEDRVELSALAADLVRYAKQVFTGSIALGF